MSETLVKVYEQKEVSRGQIHIIEDRCKGCGFCIHYCPHNVLEASKGFNKYGYHPPIVKDISKCTFCKFCEDICPDFAIFIVKKEKEGE
ncbi:MAG: 4Fe-4S binding protein [Nitrososphaerota archaeon]|nr:4Fe-4S binding protein [Nitrososphaerales archaeon]MDW8044405.1 4Fe-4S binding protein [Nitrososphaerota archaeon]